MRCIFCKNDSSNSSDIEHIIPESLGNLSKKLPLGTVCDKCNHYFGTKIEKPFIELDEIANIRFNTVIPGKNNSVPSIPCTVDGKYQAKIFRRIIDGKVISLLDFQNDVKEQFQFTNGQRALITYDSIPLKTNLICSTTISRFIAMVAVESYAYKTIEAEVDIEEFIEDPIFDGIRNLARYGIRPDWPCHIRRVYEANKTWPEIGRPDCNIVHESDFISFGYISDEDVSFQEDSTDLYFIVTIWGIEFAINMIYPTIEQYSSWLIENHNELPLHMKE